MYVHCTRKQTLFFSVSLFFCQFNSHTPSNEPKRVVEGVFPPLQQYLAMYGDILVIDQWWVPCRPWNWPLTSLWEGLSQPTLHPWQGLSCLLRLGWSLCPDLATCPPYFPSPNKSITLERKNLDLKRRRKPSSRCRCHQWGFCVTAEWRGNEGVSMVTNYSS